MAPRRTSGFTLVELLLALGLLSILLLALARLVDTSLTIWARAETSRDLSEVGGAVLELLTRDLSGLEAGPRGDVLAEWRRFDLDRDGVAGALAPRLRLVRQASPAEWRRLEVKLAVLRGDAPAPSGSGGTPGAVDPRRRGPIEVCWALLPARDASSDERPLASLWRGERRLADPSLSFFDPRFFDGAGRPVSGGLEFVTGGVLWFELLFASQTTIVHEGWRLGEELADCAASWDAYGLERPDLELTERNAPAAGMPAARDRPLLPRRVRVALELERPVDLKHRTRLAQDVPPAASEIQVLDERRLPERGRMVLVDEEWMELGPAARGTVSVVRGRRGTRPANHEAGALVHHGAPLEREVLVPVVREDWDL